MTSNDKITPGKFLFEMKKIYLEYNEPNNNWTTSDKVTEMNNKYYTHNINENFYPHFELLRLIIYKIDPNTNIIHNSNKNIRHMDNYDKYRKLKYWYNTSDDLIFLDSLLMFLEESAISLIHTRNRKSTGPNGTMIDDPFTNLLFSLNYKFRPYSKLPVTKDNKKTIFYIPGEGTTISNTQVTAFIKILKERLENIEKQLQEHTNKKREQSSEQLQEQSSEHADKKQKRGGQKKTYKRKNKTKRKRSKKREKAKKTISRSRLYGRKKKTHKTRLFR
tara:strand:- start:205 stop:1032 length:828 start_codon:yes stop_codon:yes gene_type:complete